jgi:single-strand DNA-binding protein
MNTSSQITEWFERIASRWRLLYHSEDELTEDNQQDDNLQIEPEQAKRRTSQMFQQTIIIGNLGRDPEMRYTPSGAAVTDFSVAVSRKWTSKDGTPGEETTWFRVSCWNRLAETTNQYLSKGRQVMVTGRVSTSAWIDKASGEARSALELRAFDVKFLGGGRGDQGEQAQSYPSSEEEIPF